MSVRVMFSYRGSKLFLQFHYPFTAALHRHGPVLFFIFSIVFWSAEVMRRQKYFDLGC